MQTTTQASELRSSNMRRADLSRIPQSKIAIPKQDYAALEKEIRQATYPTHAISQAQPLHQKLAKISDQKVRHKLREQLRMLNSYRQVRGDGNCFFRAFAFSYFCEQESKDYHQCFAMIDQVALDCCFPDSIPGNFKKFYDHKFLSYILKKYWKTTYQQCLQSSQNIDKKALLKVFDDNPFIDFIVVLYFRSVCLKALSSFSNELSSFLAGGQEKSIRTYSEQTEGIAIKLCSKIFAVAIVVFELRKQEANFYSYEVSAIRRNTPRINLLFYQNHYDIVEFNENIEAEKSALRRKQTLYTEVSDRLRKGICDECKSDDYVNEVSGLCMRCHEASVSRLNGFSRQGLMTARCSECSSLREDISISLGMCKVCLRQQGALMQKKEERVFQSVVRSPLKEQTATSTLKKRVSRCAYCDESGELDSETKMCEACVRSQNARLQRIEMPHEQVPSLRSQPPRMPNYEDGKCSECRLKKPVRTDSKLCDECLVSRSSMRPLPGSKPEYQNIKTAVKGNKECKACRKQIGAQRLLAGDKYCCTRCSIIG